jgi:DNA-binding transcriptional MerR regulator
MKPTIKIYRDMGYSLEDIAQVMKDKHDFYAT